jgi:thymidylate kinase
MAEERPVTRGDLDIALKMQRDDILQRMDNQRDELLERIERTETTLLKEFRKWAISFESRFKANEALVGGFSERLVSLEERVSDLESGEGRG